MTETTVDEAREALADFVLLSTEDPLITAFEAAVRAEETATLRACFEICEGMSRDITEQGAKLAALREAALPVIAIAQRAMLNRDGQPYFPEPNGALYQGDKRAIERLRALAATPAEDACSVCGVSFREHPDTDACAIAEQSR